MPVNLYNYQLAAINKMQNGCILCGGVGSGKSRTALAYYYCLMGGDLNSKDYAPMDDIHIKDLYIITTARKRDTLEWEGELTPFLLSTDKETSQYSNKVIIDSWNNIKKYSDVKDAFFIFDEQRVVGSGTWVKAFLKIAKANEWVLLSATPGDTWQDYVPVFIANGFFRNRTEFSQEHVIYKRFTSFPQIDKYVNIERLVRLRDRILINMDFERLTISHHENVMVEYDSMMYKDMIKNRWNIWDDKPFDTASELCHALRKIVNSDDSRQKAVLEIFEYHPRVIIFYNFDYELEILRSMYFGDEVEVAEWNGHKHQPIPETKSWVYLVQYNAGAEGWNCIKTDTIIFFSQNYSYKVMVQSSGRIDRLNTPYTDLYYYHLKSSSQIDLAIARALKSKKDFNANSFARMKGMKQ